MSTGFKATRWSLVWRAQGDGEEGRLALAELCEAYWEPVFRVLRRGGRDDDAARELAQSFFAHVLGGGRIAGADPGHGRFRSYLLGALRHFESDARERARRLKRGGGAEPESLDAPDVHEPAGPAWDDALFDREWAAAVVSRAMASVRRDYEESGRAALYRRLRPAIDGGDPGPHAALASDLGLGEGAVKVAVHRLRRRFREAVLQEIAQTLPEGGDVEGELRYLVEVLGKGGAGG